MTPGLHPKTSSDFLQGSCKFSAPDALFLPPQEPAAIMTDGERRASFQPPSRDEVRVPIVSGQGPSQVPQSEEEKDDDTFSACKSIQDSLASAGSSTRDPAHEGDNQVPYPTLAPTVFFCFSQSTRPRSWCLKLVCNPYPFSFGCSRRLCGLLSGLNSPRRPLVWMLVILKEVSMLVGLQLD